MNVRIVVTGTDTGIGKTVFSAALSGALDAYYWKPVQAGRQPETDAETVRRLGKVPAERILPDVCDLTTPASPHLAAERGGIEIDLARLATLPATPGDAPLVIEGAGGLMVPLTRRELQIDLFARWGLPVVLVAATRLGTINHTLLSIEALKRRGIPLLGVAFVGEENADSERTICEMGCVRRLGRLIGTRGAAPAQAAAPRDRAPPGRERPGVPRGRPAPPRARLLGRRHRGGVPGRADPAGPRPAQPRRRDLRGPPPRPHQTSTPPAGPRRTIPRRTDARTRWGRATRSAS